MQVPHLEVDAFVRSVGVNNNSPHAIFLGAGASMTSGVPSAGACIWEWKRSIFCTNNPGLEDQVSELSLPAVQDRIDRWLTANNYVPNDTDEYCYFIERCWPIADDRRRFFGKWIRKARPHIGYQLLCLLAESGMVKSIWTTNFDGLPARASAAFDLTPIEIGIDCQERVFRQPSQNELICVSLHGEYRYDQLKNTEEELQKQEEQLVAALVGTLQTHSLIVSGYSGRDTSVMKALHKALVENSGAGKIYWCGFSDTPSSLVANLLIDINEAGREAYFVPGAAFDDVMTRIALHCLDGNRLQHAKQLVGDASDNNLPERKKFTIPQQDPTGLIKSNAWIIRCPAEMFEFELREWPQSGHWKYIEKLAEGHDLVAVPLKKKVLALGTIDGIRGAFTESMKGEIRRVPIAEKDIRIENGAVINLLRKALVQSIAAKHQLNTDGRSTIWMPHESELQSYGDQSFNTYKAAKLNFRRVGLKMCVTLDPTLYIPSDSDKDSEVIRHIRMRVLGYQHNVEYNQALNDWRARLLKQGKPTEYDFPSGTGAFRFSIHSAPIFAEIFQPNKPSIPISDNTRPLIHNRGFVVSEPRLCFSGIGKESSATDMLPIRGLANNGPFDLSLSISGIDDGIRVAVICPQAEAPFLEKFLAGSTQRYDPRRGAREEYLVQYPGFREAYRLPLDIPQRGDSLWYSLSEPASDLDSEAGARDLYQKIREALSSLSATSRPVVLIFIPDRWKKWRGFETEDEVFDLHDFVKAYSVQKGIATQFLEQKTIRDPDKCRLWWWLSLAFYAKAMRTPWALEGLDSNSAFVGLGYSINRKAPKNQRIVLGCSHLYNAQGQGLQFRLSRIEDPIMRGRNAFLSYEDARRVGETIRTLFWESHLKLPRRVVIHKRTPFLFSEQKGLLAGLKGVKELELIEINFERSLRYLSSRLIGNQFEQGQFPVRRGSIIQLTDYEALLWVHGATDAAKANWTYFQGKRRIPGPVVIRRYAGNSDLATLSIEILGLSKMDWNSGDLYGKLPATVFSSNRIARIGSLLDRFEAVSYDYRLFM